MKKIILISSIFFIGCIPHAFAAGFVPLAGIPGLTQGVTADTAGLANFFNNLYKYLIGIAAILAVIEIIYSGIRIATNQDNVSAITDSKGKIWQAILGLALVLSPVLVFSIINPSILNLSLNLPALNTTTATSTTSSASASKTIPTPASDALIKNSNGISIYYTKTFDVMSLTPASVGPLLDAEQTACTQKSSGLGIFILEPGSASTFDCETCPAGTKVVLMNKGTRGYLSRGACK